MGNMSYCRFENTAGDLEDCYEALTDGVNFKNLSSDGERAGLRKLVRLARQIAEEFNEVGGDADETENESKARMDDDSVPCDTCELPDSFCQNCKVNKG